ncbi:MAG TPA: hypothetical protein DDW84_08685 [Phycisphaerales bacterium]|nr:MAG: hypothetical protein A2Y13_06090 [Planctomycetes bacterium GWC2_45_44]HBG78894.1 hypothetical protein [Phycisphaerales bacterium]
MLSLLLGISLAFLNYHGHNKINDKRKRNKHFWETIMDVKMIKNGFLEHRLGSWKEFSDLIENKEFSWPTLIYRGQANADWKVESTLDRLERLFPTTTYSVDGKSERFDRPPVWRELQLQRFKELCRGRLGTNPPLEKDEDEWWALAQHHGLATPMLDWTYSPFVALFFAFENEKFACGDKWSEPKERAVFALCYHLIDDNAKENEETPKPFSPRSYASYRLINQGGLFLKMPTGKDIATYVSSHFTEDTYSEEPTGNRHARPILQKIIIPNKERKECLWFLNKMNINRASLFPDIDGAAKHTNNLWEIDFDSAIGNIPNDLKSN